MVKLSYVKKMIDAYLSVKDDKELLSVATCQGGDDEFILHLVDIYDGPIGSNPYTGRDQIHLKKNPEEGVFVGFKCQEVSEENDPVKEDLDEDAITSKQAYYLLEKKLREDKTKSVMLKAAISWGALSTMQQVGVIDSATAEELWSAFIIKLMVRV